MHTALPDAQSGCNTGLSPACSPSGFCNGDHVSVVAEYRLNAGSTAADPASRRVIIQQTQPYRIHNAGSMVFGPDGMF